MKDGRGEMGGRGLKKGDGRHQMGGERRERTELLWFTNLDWLMIKK